MPDLEILKVQNNSDLNKCLNIREIVFVKEQHVPKSLEIDKFDTINNQCIHFLIKYKNMEVGTIRCLFINDLVKIQRFCLLKDYRNLNIGKNTLDEIEKYCKKLNIKFIKLHAQYQAYKFYEKCGYRKNSDIFYEANIKHIEMIKEI